LKLSEYAQIAEVVSGLAVVITVIVLVFEVRNNTAAVESATYDSLVSDMTAWRLAVVSNPSLIENIYSTQQLNSEGIEGVRIYERQYILMASFHIYERAYIQWQAGNLAGEGWERFERQICLDQGPGFKEGMGPRIKEAVIESFYEFWYACVE
jgi:hypothetical protein